MRRSSTTCVPYCGWLKGVTKSRGLPFLTVGRCNRVLKAGIGVGYDGAKQCKGNKGHLAVDTLGHLLALHVTPANEQDRAQVAELAAAVQEVIVHSVKATDLGSRLYGRCCGTSSQRTRDAFGSRQIAPGQTRVRPVAVRALVVERSFAWMTRFHHLARDYECLPEMLAGLHLLSFTVLLLHRSALLMVRCS